MEEKTAWNVPRMLVEAEDDVLGRLTRAPFVPVVYVSACQLERYDRRENEKKISPWPEMTACRFLTFALSESQNGWSLPASAGLFVACVEP